MTIRRALISVYEKDGIDVFAKQLVDLGVELISSGGTARYLSERGLPVTQISDITGFPEILDGRVKTIHPKIAAGILALRENPEHFQQLKQYDIQPIDMVIVNLYPFGDALSETKAHSEMMEYIDIGGTTLIRAAAKNYNNVAVITSSEQLEWVGDALQQSNGEISPEITLKLAKEAFQYTADYDAMIANYFAQRVNIDDTHPQKLILPLTRTLNLRYGENPHQLAGFYQTSAGSDIEGIEQISGIELSYNNLLDVDAAIQTATDFDDPTVVIIKHTNPCGIGCDKELHTAYQKAFASDPISAFGGILSVNRIFTKRLAENLKSHFLEVVLAPDYDPDALELLRKKKKLRILKFVPSKEIRSKWVFRSALNGVLVQKKDNVFWDSDKLKVVSDRQPTSEEWKALAFNWRVVKHVKSNAIVFGGEDRTLGIGAGQMSRVDSVELAEKKAEKAGLSLKGSVLASDAFFPFRDGVDAAAKTGATAIIQPGGSIRDTEVIDAANEHELAMVFTGIRHFRH